MKVSEMIMAFRLLSHELHGYFPNNPNAHEFKTCPEYIQQLLHLHCLSIHFVTFNKRKDSKINDHFFKLDNELKTFFLRVEMYSLMLGHLRFFLRITTHKIIHHKCDRTLK